jgi:hypothetical protein
MSAQGSVLPSSGGPCSMPRPLIGGQNQARCLPASAKVNSTGHFMGFGQVMGHNAPLRADSKRHVVERRRRLSLDVAE